MPCWAVVAAVRGAEASMNRGVVVGGSDSVVFAEPSAQPRGIKTRTRAKNSAGESITNIAKAFCDAIVGMMLLSIAALCFRLSSREVFWLD
jgi:hypothetical protein